MIKNWQSHQEYRHFLHEAKVHFDGSQCTRLTGEFAAAREKLRLLNLDLSWNFWSHNIRHLAVRLSTRRRFCVPWSLCWIRVLQALPPG